MAGSEAGSGSHPLRLEYAQAGGALSLKVDWRSPVPFAADWFDVSKLAMTAQPINYPIWLETLKALEADPAVPTNVWQETALAATKAFAPWHEAGWSLADRCLAKAMPAMQPAERMKLLLDGHTNLRQENAPNFFGYNFAGVLNTQAAMLKEKTAQLDFFKHLLRVHQSTDTKFQRLFGEVMAWGQKTLAMSLPRLLLSLARWAISSPRQLARLILPASIP